jgi:hypothetical protein
MRPLTLFLFLLYCLPSAIYSQKNLPAFKAESVSRNRDELQKKFKDFTTVKLETEKLADYIKGKQIASFRLQLKKGLDIELSLQPANIMSDDYSLKVQTEAGLVAIPSDGNFLYKGKTPGGGDVRLAIKKGFIYGAIATSDNEYFIEPLSRFSSSSSVDEYVVYEAKDVIEGENLACGVKDSPDAIARATEAQNNLREQTPQSGICKKIKFVSVADYSIYQKFNNDVYAVEAALLGNLNLAEGAFATLNLGPDGSTDVGTDKLQFEMKQIVVSVCKECDIAPGIENVSTIGSLLLKWASKNIDVKAGGIIQHWTTKPLFDIIGRGISGTISNPWSCYGISGEVLRYNSDSPDFLRVLIAHETGHAFGCPHDDDRKRDVTGFIMYSGANGSRKRFSTLADFGGMNYSSQQTIRNTILANSNCVGDCETNKCEEVKDLKLGYGNFTDSMQFGWTGTGKFLIKYKLNNSSVYDTDKIKETTFNTFTLKGLEPCALYKFEVQRNCSDTYSKASSIVFNTSSLNLTTKPINNHGNEYDLEVNLNCKNCFSKEYFIKVDNKPVSIANNNLLTQIVIKDLFADGARHRIEVTKDSGNFLCSAISQFKAPYYRSNSTALLSADFNDCTIPNGWNDSLLAQFVPTWPDAHWRVEEQNFFTPTTLRGSFDSTCMIYYNSFNVFNNVYNGSLSLTSPIIDITNYTDIKLHYDYNFLAYTFSSYPPVGSISVEAFDGLAWKKIEERIANVPGVGAKLRNIWDSLPSRVFIDLNEYKNKNFQIRFIVDDGSLYAGRAVRLFAALDNIQVDGYLKDSSKADEFIVYPNPVKDELFVQFNSLPAQAIQYKIVDASGKTISRNTLTNYRISLQGFSSGVYLLVLFKDNKFIGTKKFFKDNF